VAGTAAALLASWLLNSPGGDEEGAVGDEHAGGGQRDGAQEEEVHQLALLHVGDAVGGNAARRLARDAAAAAALGEAVAACPEAQALRRLVGRGAGAAELPAAIAGVCMHAVQTNLYSDSKFQIRLNLEER